MAACLRTIPEHTPPGHKATATWSFVIRRPSLRKKPVAHPSKEEDDIVTTALVRFFGKLGEALPGLAIAVVRLRIKSLCKIHRAITRLVRG